MSKLALALIAVLLCPLFTATAQWFPTYRSTLEPSLKAANAAIVDMGISNGRIDYIAVVTQGNTISVLDIRVALNGAISYMKYFSLNVSTLAFSSMPIVSGGSCDGAISMSAYVDSAFTRARSFGMDSATLSKLQRAFSALSFATAAACL